MPELVIQVQCHSYPEISLIPFFGMISGPIDTILNVVLFVPLRFFLPLLYKKYYRIKTVVLTGFLFSLSVEIVQMFGWGSGDWTATFHFTLMPLVICTPILIIFAILIPYICFKNLEKQSIVERLRATD